ncbi:MAG: Crp/Fnr family transcriptional regulator [Rhizobium sp.]
MSHSLTEAERSALLANRFFADMPAEARDEVARRGRGKRLGPGERLFSKGGPADGVYALLTGSLRYSTVSPSGKEAVLNILTPGKWLGDISAWDDDGRTLDCTALEQAVLMHLNMRDFNHLLDGLPAFARMLLKIQGERIRMLLAWNEALTKLDAEGRLATRLLFLMQSHGAGTDQQRIEIGLRLPQELIASLIGTTRQRVNQILLAWQERGIVEVRKRSLVILDGKALKRMVDLSSLP